MITKQELNNKLTELYVVAPYFYNHNPYMLLIDDSARMFDLMIEHDIWVQPYHSLGFVYAHARKDVIFDKVYFKDHESPQASAKYAGAMALVKLAESKL